MAAITHGADTSEFKQKKVYKKSGVSDLFKNPGSYRGRVKHKKDGGYCPVCGHNPCGGKKR